MKIGFLGGTGPEGKGLALRFAMAGHEIYIGSRDVTKSQEVSSELIGKLETILPEAPKIHGETNKNSCLYSEIIFITKLDGSPLLSFEIIFISFFEFILIE